MDLFKKTYDGESVADVYRDVGEAFDVSFNSKLKLVPQDQHGFCQGTFEVKVVWHDDATERLRTLPLAEALWWFIENVDDADPKRNDYFFLLRERVRKET